MSERTFPIQTQRGAKPHPLLIPWSVAELAYSVYAGMYGRSQSLERLAERGGFGPGEMDDFLPDWRERCDELLALRRRVAELEATAARRLEGLRPFAGLIVHDRPDYSAEWPLYDAMSDSAEWCPEVNVGHVRAAAAEVAEGDGP